MRARTRRARRGRLWAWVYLALFGPGGDEAAGEGPSDRQRKKGNERVERGDPGEGP